MQKSHSHVFKGGGGEAVDRIFHCHIRNKILEQSYIQEYRYIDSQSKTLSILSILIFLTIETTDIKNYWYFTSLLFPHNRSRSSVLCLEPLEPEVRKSTSSHSKISLKPRGRRTSAKSLLQTHKPPTEVSPWMEPITARRAYLNVGQTRHTKYAHLQQCVVSTVIQNRPRSVIGRKLANYEVLWIFNTNGRAQNFLICHKKQPAWAN